MAYRLLNSNTDPQRVICSLDLRRDLRQCLQQYLDRIWTADTIINLTHIHGRALGVGTGLGLVNAITTAQFTLLTEAYMRAFEYRLAELTERASSVMEG